MLSSTSQGCALLRGKPVHWVQETCPAGAWPRAKYQDPGICCPNYSKLTSWTFMVPFPLVHLSQEFSFKSRQETDILGGCKRARRCKQGYPHRTHEDHCGSVGQAREKRGKMTWSLGQHLPSCSPFYAKLQCRTGRDTRTRHGVCCILVPRLGIQLVLPAFEA